MGNMARRQSGARSDAATRLRETLARVAADRENVLAETQQPLADASALLSKVAAEIDETILPRKLAIVSPDGVEAAMILANRRMLEFGADSVALGQQNHGDGQLPALSYAQALQEIGDKAQGVSLKRFGRAEAPTTSSASCSAAALASAGTTLQQGNRLLEFFRAIRGDAKACILNQGAGKGVRRGGKEGLLQRLDALDQRIAARGNVPTRMKRVERAEPTCVAHGLGDNMQAIIASDGAERLLAAVSEERVRAVISGWQKVYASA